MAESSAEAAVQDVRSLPHVLATKEQLANVRRIKDFTLDGRIDGGTSGWLLHGENFQGSGTTVKLAKNPVEETGPHYEHNAQMLQEASSRTLFVPLYFDHGVTKVPGQEGMFPYIAMEHIRGQTLGDMMHTLDIQGSLDILKTVARGVDEMLPIISTDLKPSNIMIREENNRPVLIDFDIARKEGDLNHFELNEKGQLRMKASLFYAGPELAKDKSVISKELSTWQLGAIAFEMLTHQRFMNMDTTWGALYRYTKEEAFNEFLEMRMDEVGLPTATREVLSKALSFRPEDRYDSATTFVSDLDAAERQYIDSSRRKDKGHILKRPVTKILSHVVPKRRQETHNHRDASRPQKNYPGRHAQGAAKHRRSPVAR